LLTSRLPNCLGRCSFCAPENPVLCGLNAAKRRTKDQRTALGIRDGAFPAARIRRPSIQYSGVVVAPQARIAGHLTFHRLVRFPRILLTRSHCEVVWSVCYIPSGKSLACFADLRLHSYESARVAGGTSAPGHSSSPTKCEAQLFICRAISKLRAHVAQSSCACPRQLFLPVRRRAAQMLASMSMQSRQPRPRPRGTVGLAQLLGMRLHRCGACSDKQHAMRWP
jgi:hypothetical protein